MGGSVPSLLGVINVWLSGEVMLVGRGSVSSREGRRVCDLVLGLQRQEKKKRKTILFFFPWGISVSGLVICHFVFRKLRKLWPIICQIKSRQWEGRVGTCGLTADLFLCVCVCACGFEHVPVHVCERWYGSLTTFRLRVGVITEDWRGTVGIVKLDPPTREVLCLWPR